METRAYLLQALSPLHAGTGQTAGIIDLPIARMKATGIPFVPGSSVKGVLRDACRHASDRDKLFEVFGPEREVKGSAGDDSAIDHAGALIVGDARLLALPVRSFRGTFALVTSPLLLHLARRDLMEASVPATGEPLPGLPDLAPGKPGARVGTSSCNLHKGHVYLEELDLPATNDKLVDDWARLISSMVPDGGIAERLLVVDDETMSFLWDTATQVDTRVRIDSEKHVVAKGALWTEESLPPETLLVGLVAAQRGMRKEKMTAPDVLATAFGKTSRILQFGGKATVGRGRCRMLLTGAN